MIAYQLSTEGKVRAVHVIPLVDVAAVEELELMATKRPVVGLHVTANQLLPAGKVLAVHVIPLGEEAAGDASTAATATKTPVFGLDATENQYVLEDIVRAVHVIPSVDEAATLVRVDDPAMATNFCGTGPFPEKLAASEHVAPAVPPTSGKRSLLSRF